MTLVEHFWETESELLDILTNIPIDLKADDTFSYKKYIEYSKGSFAEVKLRKDSPESPSLIMLMISQLKDGLSNDPNDIQVMTKNILLKTENLSSRIGHENKSGYRLVYEANEEFPPAMSYIILSIHRRGWEEVLYH